MRPSKFSALAGLVLLGAALSLGGCSRYDFPSFNQEPKVSMTSSSYAATDMLVSQARNFITPQTPLMVGTLSDINQIETSSPLGRVIADQVAARLVQLGYNVTEVKLRQAVNVQQDSAGTAPAGEFVLSRNPENLASTTQAHAVVSGTYAQAAEGVLVNLRLMDVGTGRILAAYDYTLPMSEDVARLVGDEGGFRIFGTGAK